jgi:uncharacterized protein (DUF2237 family)
MSRKFGLSMLGSLALVVALSGAVAAQDMPASGSSSMSGMSHTGAMSADHGDMKGMKATHGHMMGMHMMPATVTEVDTTTGMVEANAEGMALKVHFPPASVASLKAGDKITLHMGYSKP